MSDETKYNGGEEELNSFGVPEGYFKSSASDLFKKLAWEEEHRDYPKLLALKKENHFITPAAYFKTSERNLELIQFEKLQKLDRKNYFTAPDKYFEINALQLDEKLDTPFLSGIQKENVFRLEKDYFELNQKELQAKLEVNKSARIIVLFRKRILYPAAAILVLTLSIVMYNSYFSVAPVQDCGTIACLDKNDLVKSSSLESMDDYELYDIVNASVLEEKLTEPQIPQQNNSGIDSNDLSADELLDEI